MHYNNNLESIAYLLSPQTHAIKHSYSVFDFT